MVKISFYEIALFPTDFLLDVIITKSEEVAREFIFNRYEELIGDFQVNPEEIFLNSILVLELPTNKKFSDTRIVLILEDLKDGATLSHELIHVLWALSDLVGIEINSDSQEWQAHMMSYLYDQIISIPKKIDDNFKRELGL